MVVGLCGILAAGCAGGEEPADTGDAAGAEMTGNGPSKDTQKEEGVITLTVWAEESNNETLEQMIAGFKEQYVGQAEFDIRLVGSLDAETRNYVLGDVHNAGDVFFLPDDQAERWQRYQTRKK